MVPGIHGDLEPSFLTSQLLVSFRCRLHYYVCLCQLESGAEKPIAFGSRTLSAAEKKYSQLDKEALSIIFGVKSFQQYLQGRHFTIMSDHKPLEYLLGENKPIPVLASARIKRWALILSAHDYEIQFRPGQQHGNADVLS